MELRCVHADRILMHDCDQYTDGREHHNDKDMSDDAGSEGSFIVSEPKAEELDLNGYLCDGFVVSDNKIEWEDDDPATASDEEESAPGPASASGLINQRLESETSSVNLIMNLVLLHLYIRWYFDVVGIHFTVVYYSDPENPRPVLIRLWY
ncbi:hypothetical protein AAF712_011260 [Marasmius tenuissimus]|uniref:Uncharacterized protein n=1 Tax=Marasmius tenuissimus TaxID=585030 RepID=A0ABR2ZLS5_9AGAR